MDRLKTTLFTALVIAILLTPAATAQPAAASLQVVSGNGQLICPTCPTSTVKFFHPMVVKVLDASGNPIVGKTVYWSLVHTDGFPPNFDSTSITDANGNAFASLWVQYLYGSLNFISFVQHIISASADAATINFTETQALTSNDSMGTQYVFAQLITQTGTVFSGQAGSTSASSIQVHVDGFGTPVPNVSVRLLSDALGNSKATAQCQTGAGADPGSVLTDSSGTATCYPVFGPDAGTAPISILAGGLDPAQFDQSTSPTPLDVPVAYAEFYSVMQLSISAVTPGLLTVVSGNNQSLNPGQSSAAMVVKLTDATGAVPVANSKIVWSVSPAGMATIGSAQTTTDSNGGTRNSVIFAPSAAGQITVRAVLSGSSTIFATFTLNTNVQLVSMTKVSGDGQTLATGQVFAPLIVQVNASNGSVAPNQTVSFSINSAGSLSAATGVTDGNGRAQVTVTAGAAAGTISVTASLGTLSQVFTLTVIPPGPALSAGRFTNAGGGARLSALAPCSLVTVIATGLAPSLQGLVFNTSSFGPWGTSLASDTVTVNGVAAPISSVGRVNNLEQLTFQVPCDAAVSSSTPIVINVGGGSGSVSLPVVAATPGIFETTMSDGSNRAAALRPDGTFVSLQNPARRGELIRVFVTGMGAAIPAVATGALPAPGTDSLLDVTKIIVGVNNGGTRVVSGRLSPNLTGVSEITFQVPSDSATGNDIVLSVAINAAGDSQTRFSNGSKLPIQ